MNILVTGGAGYIGSHTVVELTKAGHSALIVDDLRNSKTEALRRVEELTGKKIPFYKSDVLDRPALDRIFKENKIDAVIHFAALKAVGESVEKPLEYYHNNLTGTLILCQAMEAAGVRNLVFSSSATVYGENPNPPFDENQPTSATNPYGWTKVMNERILMDLQKSNPKWNVILLRYFNPVGAHESGRIGEDPAGIPNNLMPFVSQVASGLRSSLRVFGNDYPTPDGTGTRDYIHVVDLAVGHVKAVEKMVANPGVAIYNLGTGRPYSVLEMVAAFEKACGRKIPYEIVARRPGDIASCYADPAKAEKELGWKALRGVEEMCRDAWNWQKNNPKGYE